MDSFGAGSPPLLSVVVPVHQGMSVLPVTLSAIVQSDFPRSRFEVIVVDDGSTDASAAVAARWADHVVAVPRRGGPALARNRGVAASRGAWIVFVDADVRVHEDTLSRFACVIESEPTVDAIFGAYDERPSAPGFLSQYRNLLHRYVHLRGAGDADTFWAGCGAVRRVAFDAVQGFDETRYRRPQIEDIELGYRLRERGSRIVLQPDIQGTHLKEWRFARAVRTDVIDRGVPWVRLLLERRSLHLSANLNLKAGERLKTTLTFTGAAGVIAGAIVGDWRVGIAGLVALTAVLFSNRHMLGWFARQRGAWFAIRVAPMNLLYYVLSGVSVVLGIALHIVRRRQTLNREPPLPNQST